MSPKHYWTFTFSVALGAYRTEFTPTNKEYVTLKNLAEEIVYTR